MDQSPDDILARINENLHYVAKDAERLRPTELVLTSAEMLEATVALDTLILESPTIGTLILRIGQTAVDGLSFSINQYDTAEIHHHLVEPGEQHELRYKYPVPTNTFEPNSPMKPVYGFLRYFDLATIGQTIEDGGELTLSEPDSSSNT